MLILWAGLWLGSLVLPALQVPTGDGFTRGLNRVTTFFGFQIAATLAALILVPLRPASGWARRAVWIPAALAALLAVFMLGLILNAEFASPLDGITDDRPVTAPATPTLPVKPTVGD